MDEAGLADFLLAHCPIHPNSGTTDGKKLSYSREPEVNIKIHRMTTR